jgi:ATP-dependent HslUV protease subunit HslV
MKTHATTILTVRHQGIVAMGGDGQVSVGDSIMKVPMPSRSWSGSRRS